LVYLFSLSDLRQYLKKDRIEELDWEMAVA
jgi:hypothetical protein